MSENRKFTQVSLTFRTAYDVDLAVSEAIDALGAIEDFDLMSIEADQVVSFTKLEG